MVRRVRVSTLLLPFLLAACTDIERLMIPDAALIAADFAEHGAERGVDHGAWSDFLARHARMDGAGIVRVDYGAVGGADRDLLRGYLHRLMALDASRLTRPEQLAYWVNLYNAATVDVILAHYPVPSIRAIRRHPLDPGPWDEARLTVGDRTLGLHDIEHGIIRPLWPERPEIHYLLNCGAVGCPNLGLRAYAGDDIEEALDAAARAFVNDPRGVALLDDGRLQVSKVYAWYREDFGDTSEAVLHHLRQWAAPPLRERLEGRTRIDRFAYDWALNDASVDR